jgi:hypothetical protein
MDQIGGQVSRAASRGQDTGDRAHHPVGSHSAGRNADVTAVEGPVDPRAISTDGSR